jgi:hypothetical protein
LNIGPPLSSSDAPVGVVAIMTTQRRFQDFCVKVQNGFVGQGNCFVAMSRQNSPDESFGLKAAI